MTSRREKLEQMCAFDRDLHSERSRRLYDESYEHAERYRLIIAGKTGAEREHRRLQPLLALLPELVEAVAEGCDRASEHSTGCLFCGEDEEYVREHGESSKEHKALCWYYRAEDALRKVDEVLK